jgi:cytidine deaminase
MYQANAISLRSSDANRQVGAVIVNIDDPLNSNNLRKADVIAVGMNEVPRGGGGPYWEGASPDARDQALEHINKEGDRAAEIKVSILTEVIEKIVQKKWLEEAASRKPVSELAGSLLEDLKGTQFLDIGEFSRPVHAEMAALIDAARRGVAVDGSSMYVTTFPCHNCAKHIIAAGIQRVVYLEPYPKSRATHLYDEEIYPKSQKGVRFVAFSGVAPRQYRRLFSMSKRGAKRGYPLPKWEAEKHSLWPPYVPQNASLLYHDAERRALQNLTPGIYSKPGIA